MLVVCGLAGEDLAAAFFTFGSLIATSVNLLGTFEVHSFALVFENEHIIFVSFCLQNTANS